MTRHLIPTHMIVVVGIIVAAMLLIVSCGQPAYAAPSLDNFPPKIGATIGVTTVCDTAGYEVMNIAFEADTPMNEMNNIYKWLLADRSCVSLGVYSVDVVVTAVSAPIHMSDGSIVFALTIDVDGAPEQFYTFVIGIQKQGISL